MVCDTVLFIIRAIAAMANKTECIHGALVFVHLGVFSPPVHSCNITVFSNGMLTVSYASAIAQCEQSRSRGDSRTLELSDTNETLSVTERPRHGCCCMSY